MAKFFHILKMPAQRIQELDWLIPARKNLEKSINLSATEYGYDSYENMIYSKAAAGVQLPPDLSGRFTL